MDTAADDEVLVAVKKTGALQRWQFSVLGRSFDIY